VLGHYWPELLRSKERVIGDVRAALASDWELLVIASYPQWSAYPEDIRASVLAAVASGKSLIVGDLGAGFESDVKAAGLKLDSVELGAGRFRVPGEESTAITGYRCGKGFVLPYSVGPDARFGYLLSASALQADFERSAAKAGWILRQAARPETTSYLTSVEAVDRVVRVKMAAHATPSGSPVSVAVRRRDTYECVVQKTKKAASASAFTLELPHVPTGDYIAEVRILDASGVTLDWDAVVFSVAGPTQVTAVTIEDNAVAAGDTVSVQIATEGSTDGLRHLIEIKLPSL
jgi:hypothetical protein